MFPYYVSSYKYSFIQLTANLCANFRPLFSADVSSGPENKLVVVSSEGFALAISPAHLLKRELFVGVRLFYSEEDVSSNKFLRRWENQM